MKHILLFIPILIFNFCGIHAQTKDNYQQIFTYKYSYKLDSLSNNYKKENMLLLTNTSNSYFVSTSNYLRDSISATKEYIGKSQSEQISILRKYPTQNGYYILTFPSKNLITYTERANVIPETTPVYEEKIINNWKLSNEHKIISGLKCKKATQKLFGRNWIAWYSLEIPAPFGPYKFFGLPGLIVEVYDIEKEYSFTLTRREKISFNFPKQKFDNLQKTTKQKTIDLINKGKYTTAIFDGASVMKDGMVDDLSKMQKMLDERRKKENNPIELQINP